MKIMKRPDVKLIKIISAAILLGVNIVVGMFLGSMGRYIDMFIFLFFAVGMFWYIRLILTERKHGPWFELDNMEEM